MATNQERRGTSYSIGAPADGNGARDVVLDCGACDDSAVVTVAPRDREEYGSWIGAAGKIIVAIAGDAWEIDEGGQPIHSPCKE